MEALIRLFGEICRFKKGPEDVPTSFNFLIVILLVNFIVESLLGLTVYSLAVSTLLASLSIISLLAFVGIWLFLFKLNNRLIQSSIAFIGVNLFTNIICFMPIALTWKMGILSDNSFGLLNLLLIAWILSIYAHIFRNSLSISFFLGFALAITYFITFNTLTIKILGV